MATNQTESPSNHVLLVSGHRYSPHAGASSVFVNLESALRSSGVDVSAWHSDDWADGKFAQRATRFLGGVILCHYFVKRMGHINNVGIIEVAGNLGWKLFSHLRHGSSSAIPQPLLVSRLHGLEFKDEQARVDEEIAYQIRLPHKYKLLSRHLINWQEKATILAADVVICHSSRDKDAIVAAGWKRESEVEVMPLGVDARFHGAASVRVYRETGDRFLWWGSWTERKGIHYLPRIWKLVAGQLPNALLTLGGTGRNAEQLLPLFDESVRMRIRVLPFLDEAGHLETLLNHDIFLFPSLSEGFGLALLEAVATGMASVTTFTGMAHDHLEHGRDCLLVPMSSPAPTARAMVRLAEDRELRERIGRQAARMAAGLTWERTAKATLDVYSAHRERVNIPRHSKQLLEPGSSVAS